MAVRWKSRKEFVQNENQCRYSGSHAPCDRPLREHRAIRKKNRCGPQHRVVLDERKNPEYQRHRRKFEWKRKGKKGDQWQSNKKAIKKICKDIINQTNGSKKRKNSSIIFLVKKGKNKLSATASLLHHARS